MSGQNATSYKQHATLPFTHFLLHVFEVSKDYVEVIVILQWHKGVSIGMTTMQTYMYLFTHQWSQHLTIIWKLKFLQQDLRHHFTKQPI
jgi:hypothetical protein